MQKQKIINESTDFLVAIPRYSSFSKHDIYLEYASPKVLEEHA